MIATLAAMLRDERGAPEPTEPSSQYDGSVPRIPAAPTLYPSLLQALREGYQVHDKAPGVYFLRQRFPEGWKFAHVLYGGNTRADSFLGGPYGSV